MTLQTNRKKRNYYGMFFPVLGQYGPVLVGTWCFWVSMGQYWLVLGVTGSVWGGTGWYLVELGHYGQHWLVLCGAVSVWGSSGWYLLVLVGIWWYSVRIIWYCLVSSSTGSVKRFYASIYIY